MFQSCSITGPVDYPHNSSLAQIPKFFPALGVVAKVHHRHVVWDASPILPGCRSWSTAPVSIDAAPALTASESGMVIPLISETEWMPMIEAAVPWELHPYGSAWVIAPHPDDETLAVGGTLARLAQSGIDVAVIAVTDGENAYQRNDGLATIRISEQQSALARLGIGPERIHRLGFSDSGVSDHEDSLRSAFCELINPGSLVLAPWTSDFHPDHEVCGRAAQEACKRLGADCVFYFFWTWNRGRPEQLERTRLRKILLSPQEREAKLEALHAHRSQLTSCGAEPPILPENLLWPARMEWEVYLP